MQELIVGGIYITKNDNYLVVVNDEIIKTLFGPRKQYILVLFKEKEFEQKQVQTLDSIPIETYKNETYFIDSDSKYMEYYFNNGYCGKIQEKLLNKIIQEFNEYKLNLPNEFADLDYWKQYKYSLI